MQGVRRRITYVLGYEAFSLVIATTGLAVLGGSAAATTLPLAVVISLVAVSWNYVYNLLFELWEARQVSRARSLRRRIVHAIGFQATLVVFLVPLIAWWMKITLLEAFILDLALIIIIPCYTFIYAWVFDKLFGLPLSAVDEAGAGTA